MELKELIRHPDRMDRDTLFELRSLLALYPYFQTVRLLMLQNLYLLRDPSFDEELRRAAIYITDRKIIFNLVEAGHYQLRKTEQAPARKADDDGQSRTVALIDNFLDSMPKDTGEEDTSSKRKKKRQPTPADAAIDYVAYLLETEDSDDDHDEEQPEVPQMKGQSLIDDFINKDEGKFSLKETPEYLPETEDTTVSRKEKGKDGKNEGYFTETLARIYVKQGRYDKALEIIQKLSEDLPHKKVYFDDQIRFLQKLLIINSKNK